MSYLMTWASSRENAPHLRQSAFEAQTCELFLLLTTTTTTTTTTTSLLALLEPHIAVKKRGSRKKARCCRVWWRKCVWSTCFSFLGPPAPPRGLLFVDCVSRRAKETLFSIHPSMWDEGMLWGEEIWDEVGGGVSDVLRARSTCFSPNPTQPNPHSWRAGQLPVSSRA